MSSIIIKRAVHQLLSLSSPQYSSSLSKSGPDELYGLEIHEASMENDGNSTRQCESMIGTANNHLRFGVVDTPLWCFTNSSSFKTIWISHEFRIHRIQPVLISRMSFYFVKSKRAIIDVLSIQPL